MSYIFWIVVIFVVPNKLLHVNLVRDRRFVASFMQVYNKLALFETDKMPFGRPRTVWGEVYKHSDAKSNGGTAARLIRSSQVTILSKKGRNLTKLNSHILY